MDSDLAPLPGSTFGAALRIPSDRDTNSAIAAFEAEPGLLNDLLNRAGGLLLFPALRAIAEEPAMLVRLSRLFGSEVEDYRRTLSESRMIHPRHGEIYVLGNRPPSCRQPPAPPDPPRTEEGALPVQFPHRRGWHTDQSFRRPPPDISLFYAVRACPKGQGQTLFADGSGAYEHLPAHQKRRIENLAGIHVYPYWGRSEDDVRAGKTPRPLAPHEQPQRQPVVRVHPETGKRALYLCESGQMDWILGPFAGMERGPDGEGAALLYELMAHFTQPRFTYAHEWEDGDLIVYDNRCLAHCATWFDAARHERLMWRTTVWGNPGELYAGEDRSWVAEGT
jgi:taurine dioxygenase